MVQYYTLEQAAKILQITPDKLREMVKLNKIRAFQDRGTLRFRASEIDELARTWGLGSDAELKVVDPPSGTRGGAASSSARRRAPQPGGGQGDEGQVPLGEGPTGGPASSRSRRKSSLDSGMRSPPPRASTDSDVRLVPDGSDLDFQIDSEKGEAHSSPSTASKRPIRPGPRPSKISDSEIRMVPLDEASDSDVRIEKPRHKDSQVHLEPSGKTPSDSDIALERDIGDHQDYDPLITEEIDLDAEQRKAEQQKSEGSRPRPGSSAQQPALPTSSPFELSQSDFGMDESHASDLDSDSEFELTMEEDLSPLASDDEISLGGDLSGGPNQSGINLQDPADSGISLEPGGSDEYEFGLSLDAGPSSGSASANEQSEFELTLDSEDSSSEFELTLDSEDSGAVGSSSEFELTLQEDDSSSEFELSLDEVGSSAAGEEFELSLDEVGVEEDEESGSSEFELTLDEEEGAGLEEESSSEFELTLDEEGELTASEEDEEDKDIFETDFEVPALDEESESEAVALEDEESSEFDLDLEEEVLAEEDEESESEVVEIDEDDDADSLAATRPALRRQRQPLMEDEDEDGLDLEIDPVVEEEEEEEVVVGAGAPAAAPSVPWGVFPTLMLFPAVIVLFLVGIMTWELMQGMWGYHKPARVPSLIVDPLARQLDENLPKH